MSNYRRIYQKGGKYFFTVVTYNRRPILTSQYSIIRLRESFRRTMRKLPFYIDGIVILPDHIHSIWTLPNNDANFSLRWKTIRHHFSIGFISRKNNRQEKQIWQKRFWAHLITNELDYQKHMDYLYYNPVKHGYVLSPYDWPYSSFKRDIERGLYTASWASFDAPNNIRDINCE